MALKQTNLKLKNVSVSNESSDDEEEKTDVSLDISLEKLNLGPKKKLLVIALGGLLVHRQHVREKIPPNIRPDVYHGNFRGNLISMWLYVLLLLYNLDQDKLYDYAFHYCVLVLFLCSV